MPDSSSLPNNAGTREPISWHGPIIDRRSNTFHRTVLEATVLFIVACILGLGYSAIRGKGVFGIAPTTQAVLSGAAEPAPTFITYEEAVKFYTSGKAVFVDARNEYDYNLGHIKGAINIPLKEFDNRRSILDTYRKDSLLIAYCDGVECGSSIDLGRRLAGAGFIDVKIFFGGWNEWKTHDQPIGQ